MDEYGLFIIIFICSVFISSISQVMLKISANKEYASRKEEYLNPLVITAYLLFFGATLVTVFAFKYVPLSMGPILEALGYIFVGVLGVLVLKEKISLRHFIGMVFIVVGVIVCTM